MITSKTNPQIKALVRLQKSSERRKTNRILIEGRREIERAIAFNVIIETLYYCPDLCPDIPKWPTKNRIAVSKEVFEKIAYRSESDGLLAVSFPPETSLEKLQLSQNPLIIVLEAVEKPGNLGAILRTADAAGADAILACDPLTDIYNPNALVWVVCLVCRLLHAAAMMPSIGSNLKRFRFLQLIWKLPSTTLMLVLPCHQPLWRERNQLVYPSSGSTLLIKT